MAKLGVCLPNTKPQGESIVHAGMRQVKITTPVETIHELAVELVSSAMTKTNQIQRREHSQFKTLVLFNPGRKLLCQLDMSADMMPQSLHPVMSDDKPELQRTETASERNLPVAVVDHRSGFGGFIAQIFRQYTQGLNQSIAICNIKTIAVKVGEHPLVGVEAIAVGHFQPVVNPTILRT